MPLWNVTVTKHSVLKLSAMVFDPIGFLTPCTVEMKILFQELCLDKIDWDSNLPGGGAHDSNSARYLFRVPMIHRFMTSHPVAELLLCFHAKHQDGRPMPFGFLVILTHRLTELCILNAENLEKVSSRPFKQIS